MNSLLATNHPRHGGADSSAPVLAAVFLALAVTGFLAAEAVDAAWGWGDTASVAYGIAAMLLVVAGAFLVATQVRLGQLHQGLGTVAMVGIAITAAGALLSFVAWAVALWTALMGLGTVLFGLPLLRRGLVPRSLALILTFALPAAAISTWVGVILFGAGSDDGSDVAAGIANGLVGVALLALSVGLVGVRNWMRTTDAGAA